MKGLRRAIIVICVLLLGVKVFQNLPESKYYFEDLKTLVDTKKAQVIEVGKGMKIDKDTVFIKRIINTQDNTCIRYTFIRLEQGWSFPDSTIKMFDDKGRQYLYDSAGSSGKMWGQDGLIMFDRLNDDVKYITLKIDCYDIKSELKISLGKEGKIIEN
jgi:hypothetical protein